MAAPAGETALQRSADGPIQVDQFRLAAHANAVGWVGEPHAARAGCRGRSHIAHLNLYPIFQPPIAQPGAHILDGRRITVAGEDWLLARGPFERNRVRTNLSP